VDGDVISKSICAPLTVTGASGGPTAAFGDLIAEAGHGLAPNFLFGPGSICVVDDGTNNQIRLRISREGTAESPTFAPIFGAQNVEFFHVILGDLPARIYDSQGGTFNLPGLLKDGATLPMTARARILDDVSGDLIYVAVINGTMTFSFDGTL